MRRRSFESVNNISYNINLQWRIPAHWNCKNTYNNFGAVDYGNIERGKFYFTDVLTTSQIPFGFYLVVKKRNSFPCMTRFLQMLK